jgi:hypothetical protein
MTVTAKILAVKTGGMKTMANAAQVNGAQVAALKKEGYTGGFNLMTMQWLRFEGAVGDSLPQLWLSFLLVQPGEQRHQKEAAWLRGLGYIQSSLTDQQLAYWRDRALVVVATFENLTGIRRLPRARNRNP